MIERDGEISESWDQEILQTFAEGRAEEISRLTADEIQAEGGNGGTEVRNWLVMAATVPGNRGAKVLYEPVYPWKTGMAAIEMEVEEPAHS
nr:B363 [uncultured bacterium]